MAYQKQKQHRLPGYDYTQPGSYFITIGTHEREHFFGEVERGQVSLTTIGRTAEYFLQKIPHTFKNSTLDTWVVMPNHVHLVLVLRADGSKISGYAPRPPWNGAYPLYPLASPISIFLTSQRAFARLPKVQLLSSSTISKAM